VVALALTPSGELLRRASSHAEHPSPGADQLGSARHPLRNRPGGARDGCVVGNKTAGGAVVLVAERQWREMRQAELAPDGGLKGVLLVDRLERHDIEVGP